MKQNFWDTTSKYYKNQVADLLVDMEERDIIIEKLKKELEDRKDKKRC